MICVGMTEGQPLSGASPRFSSGGARRANERDEEVGQSYFVCRHLFPLLREAVIETTSRMSRKTFLSAHVLADSSASI